MRSARRLGCSFTRESGRAFLGRTHVSTHQKDVSLWAMRVPGGSAPGHGSHKQRWEARVCPVHPRVSKEPMCVERSRGGAPGGVGVKEGLWLYPRKMGAGEGTSRGERWVPSIVKGSPDAQWRTDHRRQEWNQGDDWAE